jgi:hypothetical protein
MAENPYAAPQEESFQDLRPKRLRRFALGVALVCGVVAAPLAFAACFAIALLGMTAVGFDPTRNSSILPMLAGVLGAVLGVVIVLLIATQSMTQVKDS